MSKLRIVPYEPRFLGELQHFINREIAVIPPYWQLSAAQVAAILDHDTLWAIHFVDEPPQPWRWQSMTLCAVDDQDHLLGAMRLDQRYDAAHVTMTLGRWLVGAPEHPEGVRALLDHLTRLYKEGDYQLWVNGRYDFGIGWSGVPVSSAYLTEALHDSGFLPIQKWVVMTADISRWAASGARAAPAGCEVRWRVDEMHRERDIQLYANGIMVGECQAWGIPEVFADCTDYPAWMQIEWLGVDEAYQRRGLGRWMLEEQLRWHAGNGVRHCLLYTGVDNVAAQAVNRALGFDTKAEVWGWAWQA